MSCLRNQRLGPLESPRGSGPEFIRWGLTPKLHPMLRISSLTLRRGARALLENASMIVHPGQKVGLVGPNGSGKSSLFALVRGELHADAGVVEMPPRWVLAHVAQETPALERPALEFVMDGDEELRQVEAEIAEEAEVTGEHLAEL